MNDSEILVKARDAFVAGDNLAVISLLTPIINFPEKSVRGTINFILGLSFMSERDIKPAMESFARAVEANFDDPTLYENYGALLQRSAQYDLAEEIYSKGLTFGENAKLLSHLATINIMRGKITEASGLLDRSLNLDPNDHMAWTNLGNLNQQRCHYRDAVNCYKKAIKIKPDYQAAISNLLLTANYTPMDQPSVFEAHKHYLSQIEPVKFNKTPQVPNKKIRVAYISSDFKTHSVSYFFAPILKNHNRDKFETVCYSDVVRPDPVTQELINSCDIWRDVSAQSIEHITQLIWDDNIDILVDLAGHVGNRFLPLFRAKPAKIQVTYLGYPNTTGLPEMDYRLVDKLTDLKENEQFYSEMLHYLPAPFIRYQSPSSLPTISKLPASQNGFTTFGSFNNLAKLSEKTFSLWSKLLLSTPNSKLYLKSKSLKDDNIKNDVMLKFEAEGVDRSRVKLEGHKDSLDSHLVSYNQIDIALDTFPYNGTTTTCEALVMGVPILTIAGDRHASRVGVTLLSALGLDNWICNSDDEFIKSGIKLSENYDSLSNLREELRDKFMSSKLSHPQDLVAEMENFFEEVLDKN
jgi:protein O-GlcNAc transferase